MMHFSDDKPIWRQIYELIAMRILSGEWREEERVVSVRELAQELGVNANTVMRSYERLEADGIIFNRRDIGFYVSLGAVAHIRDIERSKFISEELPKLADRLALLGLKIEVHE